MKPLPSPFILALLLMPWVLGPAPAGQGPGVMLRPCCDAAAAPGVSEGKWGLGSLQEIPFSGVVSCLLTNPSHKSFCTALRD